MAPYETEVRRGLEPVFDLLHTWKIVHLLSESLLMLWLLYFVSVIEILSNITSNYCKLSLLEIIKSIFQTAS